MFDARSLLEHLVRGGGQPQQAQQAPSGGLADILGQLGAAMGQQGGSGQGGAAPSQGGGLGDILGRLGEAMGQQGGGGQRTSAPSQSGGQGGGGLGDILGRLGEAMGQPAQSQTRQIAPENRGSADRGAGGQGASLEDLLKNMLPGGGQSGDGRQSGGGGGLMDSLGQVLGQATQGVKEGAGRIDEATGASRHARDAVGQATGKNPDELLEQLKELVRNNQLGAGAVAGGLGGVLLGTKAGRSLATSALKLGGLALIGGLAYKALQNYQQGRPPLGGQGPGASALIEAPRGSGFEAEAVTNDSALLYIRAMIAAAAADGRIDAAEQQKMLGSLQQAGIDRGAEEFLANELNNPATADDLVRAVQTEVEAVQVFTAARVAIDLDTQEEHQFLVSLAQGLGLDGNLVAHIDAEARSQG